MEAGWAPCGEKIRIIFAMRAPPSRVERLTRLQDVCCAESRWYLMPAYARFIAIPGSSALASAWRPESERSASNVGARIGLGVLRGVGSNAFTEFWPDVRHIIFRRKPSQGSFANLQPH